MAVSIDRLKTGMPELDAYIDYLCSEIEAARNVTASHPIQARVTPNGLQLAGSVPGIRLAKSKSGGVPKMTGSAPGKADVTLWDYDGSNISSQTVDVEAINLSTLDDVGGSKLILIVPFGKWWIVIWEECPA